MRRFPLIAAALLLAAPAYGQFPGGGVGPFVPPPQVQPLPFQPYVPPVRFNGVAGRDYINSVIPDRRVLAGAAFFNTEFERTYARLYRTVQALPPVGTEPPPPPTPAIDPNAAVISLQVPEMSEVYVNGERLDQPGSERQIVTPPLPGGQQFNYGIVVRWRDDQKVVERQLNVTVGAGDRPVLLVMAPLAGR